MVDYHPYSDAIKDDPYPVYRRMRDERPALYLEEYDCWFLSRFEDIWSVNSRYRALDSSRGTTPGQLLIGTEAVNPALTSMDPPAHSKYRGLISPAFKPNAVKALEPVVRERARALARGLRETGGIDVVRDFAAQVAIRVVCELGGTRFEDKDRMLAWSNAIMEREDGHRGITDAGHQAAREMFSYYFEYVKEMRAQPHRWKGLLGVLLGTDLDGGMSDATIASYLCLALIGGTDTFPKAFASLVCRLRESPDQRRVLAADAAAIPDAFEEALRHTTPTQMLGRTLAQEIELHGETLRPGQKVMFLFASAGRDEREFPEPDRFDIARRRERTIAFGHGPHVCLGMHTARLEARIALEELLAVAPEYELDLARAERLRTEFVQGFTSLPLVARG